MIRLIGLLAGALLFSGSAAATPEARVLEPLLREVSLGDAHTVRRAYPASALSDGRLRLLVRLRQGVDPSVLAGFDTEAGFGGVVPVRIKPERLPALAALPGVIQVEACRTLRPHLDRSLAEVGAKAVHTSLSLDGAGVIVGIVDTGLDFRHRDFQDASGKTRLLYLVDFSQQPEKGALGESYNARAYTEAEINNQLALDRSLGVLAPPLIPHQDRSGHGTHVAGIAAGNGRDAAAGFNPGRYVGVAKGARIIAAQAARANDGAFHDADVLSAIRFIFDRAKALGLPAVINLSLGTQLGPHDGTSNLARAISNFTGPQKPGRVIVSSAGNDGGRDIHASGYPGLDGASTVTLAIPPYTPTSARELVHLEIWYGGGAMDITLTSPGGQTFGPVPTGKKLEQQTDEGLVQLLNAQGGPYAGNGRNMAVLVVDERNGKSPAPGDWSIQLAGAAQRYDVWLVNPAISGPTGRPRLRGPLDPDTRLSSPGTARGVISVAAYTTRTLWTSRAGKIALQSTLSGEHAFFSSTGPSLDGRFVPDIAAPGQFIISAMSRHAQPFSSASSFYVPEVPFALWADDQVRGLLRGTSQAAPHVTGVVALLLQRSPTLTVDKARELLRVGARPDGAMASGRGWSPRWGFGKLDAARSLAALEQKPAGRADPRKSTVGVNRDLLPARSAERASITVVPRDINSRLLGPGRQVSVTATAGRTSAAVHRAYGRYEATLEPGTVMGAAARITVKVDGIELAHKPTVYFTTRRSLVGGALRARGAGCGVNNNGGVGGWWSVLIVLAMIAAARRRGGATGASPQAGRRRPSPPRSPH